MMCLQSLVGVSLMDRASMEVRREAGIERNSRSLSASRAAQRVCRWFGDLGRMDEHLMAKRVLMADVSGGRV